MNETIIMNPMFHIVGIISFAASSLALACSVGHAIFYFHQRIEQPGEFLRGLACRMKAMFSVMSAMFLLDLITGYGLIVDYTMWMWLAICAVKACISVAYVASLFWLYAFYRRLDV